MNRAKYYLCKYYDEQDKLLALRRNVTMLTRFLCSDVAGWCKEVAKVDVQRYRRIRDLLRAERLAIKNEKPINLLESQKGDLK